MELLGNILHGFSVALDVQNFLFCLVGAALGTMVGVLPGLGAVTTIAMLLPVTFKLPAIASFIMLAGIYYGAHHAGSTTAIMLNMPGEPSSVVVCLDGHPMARQGRAGVALCISALGSFFAGCVCIVIIALFSPPFAHLALLFGAPEYTSLILLALISASLLASNSLLKTVSMAVLGLLLGTVGTDATTGIPRFSFGSPQLVDGIHFISVAVGLFAFAEIVENLGPEKLTPSKLENVKSLLPTREDMRLAWKPILRGTAIGGVLGTLPGTGPMIASFASYTLERQLARDPSRFGQGAIEGVAGPETANNAAAFTHFIPMFSLGIPAGPAMALLLGAMMIQGIAPGPQVMTQQPDLFWGVVASMWIGNLMLLVLNLPMIGVWIRLLMTPYRLIYPTIIVLCCIGVYSVSNAAFDVWIAAGAGLFGYIFKKLGCPPAPMLIGLILGPLFEDNFRRSLLMSRGDPTVFLSHPISLVLLLMVIVLIVIVPGLRMWRTRLGREVHTAFRA